MQIISPVLAGAFDTAAYQPAASNINAAATTANAANADAAASAQATDFTTTIGSNATSAADPRRYSKFDHSASNVADAPNFSFSDFVDMVNPLQHIPVVSSVYRAATGDTINPVARVAGDIMYGGALGAISAAVGGASAVGDAVAESDTGKDKIGNVFASLFGDDKDQTQTTQLASASTTNAAASVPSLLAAPAAPVTMASSAYTTTPSPTLSSLLATQQIASNTATPAATPAASTSTDATTAATGGKAFPLTASNRMPFGGVMDTGNSIEAQNAAIALADGSHAMRIGHTIYTSRLMNGPHPLPIASTPATPTTTATTATAAATVPATTNPAVAAALNEANAASVAAITGAAPATVSSTTGAATSATPSAGAASASIATPANTSASSIMSAGMSPNPTQSLSPATLAAGHNPLPQNLVDDIVMMRALGQYQGVASGTPALGANVDMRN
jgi:hypothetical protein